MYRVTKLIWVSLLFATGCSGTAGLANAPNLGGTQVSPRRPPDVVSDGLESCDRDPSSVPSSWNRRPTCPKQGLSVFPLAATTPVAPPPPPPTKTSPWSPRIDSECWTTSTGELAAQCCLRSHEICVVN